MQETRVGTVVPNLTDLPAAGKSAARTTFSPHCRAKSYTIREPEPGRKRRDCQRPGLVCAPDIDKHKWRPDDDKVEALAVRPCGDCGGQRRTSTTSDNEVQEPGVEGFTRAVRKLDLIPPEPGIITSLAVHEGDRVEKNQLLGSLDCETQQIALEIAKANMAAHGKLDSATAERDLRRWRLAKLQKLHEEGHANDEEVTRVASELAVADANVLTASNSTPPTRLKSIASLR